MPETNKPRFDCKCIDEDSKFELKIALITAKDTYTDISTKMENVIESGKLLEKANTFALLIQEVEKIPSC